MFSLRALLVPSLAGLVALPGAAPEDPRAVLHAETLAYFERLQEARTVYLEGGRTMVEAEGEFLLTATAHTSHTDPGTLGMPLRTAIVYTVANSIGLPASGVGLKLRAFTHREPTFETEEVWCEDLGEGRYRQKWILTETVEEPENVEELYRIDRRPSWVLRKKPHALQFLLERNEGHTAFLPPNLTTWRGEDVPNEVRRHLGLIGPSVLDLVWPRQARDGERPR